MQRNQYTTTCYAVSLSRFNQFSKPLSVMYGWSFLSMTISTKILVVNFAVGLSNVPLERHFENRSAVETVLCLISLQIIGNKLENYSWWNLFSLTKTVLRGIILTKLGRKYTNRPTVHIPVVPSKWDIGRSPRFKLEENRILTGNEKQAVTLDLFSGSCEVRVTGTALVECIARLTDDTLFLLHQLLKFLPNNCKKK